METIKTFLPGMLLLILCTRNTQAIEVPSYDAIFMEQLKCNAKSFSNYRWDSKASGLGKLDSEYFAVISKPVITEVSPFIKTRKSRTFKVDFTEYDVFMCKKRKEPPINELKITTKQVYFNIFEANEGSNTLSIISLEAEDVPGADKKLFSSPRYLHTDDGLACLVLIDNLLSNPNLIDLDKVCKGKSAKDKEATKKAVEQAVQAWKAAGVGK